LKWARLAQPSTVPLGPQSGSTPVAHMRAKVQLPIVLASTMYNVSLLVSWVRSRAAVAAAPLDFLILYGNED
jgi:hypothetical protein